MHIPGWDNRRVVGTVLQPGSVSGAVVGGLPLPRTFAQPYVIRLSIIGVFLVGRLQQVLRILRLLAPSLEEASIN